ncbi:unnamed protein product [Prunus armeniaca]
MIREFLEVLTCLGHMSQESSLDRTVGLLTIARSDDYCKLSPRVGLFGVSGTPIHNLLNPTQSWNYIGQHIRNRMRSNGSNVSNPEIAQYARSVRGSNVVRIQIREFLHARDNIRIILEIMSDHHPAHAPSHSPEACGCLDKFQCPENFKVEGQVSYPR